MKNFKEINRTFTVKTNSIFNAVCKTKYLALLVVLIFTCGNVWAASPATLTFSAACGESGTDSDGNTWTVTSDAAESTYDATKGIHYGTSKAAVSYLNLTTSGISGTITQIQVNASGASSTSAKLNVTVGGSAFGTEQSLTSSATTYTLTGSASGNIVVAITQSSATKALYCKSITVTYSSGGGGGCSAPDAPTISGTAAYTEGETITLTATCASGADASTTYTWYKGADWATASAASPVQAATTGSSGYTFTKANCVTGDAGKYWCKASNGSECDANNATGYDITVSAWSGTEYVLVTSTEDLEAGANYVIGSADATSGYFMSTAVSTNNRQRTDSITISNTNKITTTAEVLVLELGGDATDGWTFETTNYLGTDGYLTSAASDNNNHCKVVTPAEACSYFTIEFSGNAAVITSNGRNERNILKYNSSNKPPIFACYSSGQNPVYLYKEVEACVAPTSVSITGTNKYLGGQEIILTAAPQGGTGTPSYQWQKKISGTWQNVTDGTTAGVTISGANTNNLTITPCTHENSGGYRCIVSTGDGCEKKSHADDTDGYGVHVFSIHGKYTSDANYTDTEINWTSGTTGTATITMEAKKTYLFKVWSNNGYYYGHGANTNEDFMFQPTTWDCGINNNEMRLFTTVAGNYTFTINIEHGLDNSPYVNVQVGYPSMTHPNSGYVYVQKFSWRPYLHYWYDNSHLLSAWGSDPQLNSDQYTNICGTDYWCVPVIDYYCNFIAKDAAGNPSNTTGDQHTNSPHPGQKLYNDGSWKWGSLSTYTITYAAGDGSGTMAATNGICSGNSQQLPPCTFDAPSHYHFTNWTASPAVTVGGASTTTVADEATIQNINADITLTANWTADEYTITKTLTHVSSTPTIPSTYTYTGSAAGLSYSFTADEGYALPESVTVIGSTYTWTNGVLTLTGTITGNVSITVEGVQADTYIDNIWNTATQTKTGTYTRPSIGDQTPGGLTDCQHLHYHFVGWITKAKYDAGTTIDARTTPTGDLVAGGSVTASGATFYAVWEKASSGGVSSYTELTDVSELAAGDHIIITDGVDAGMKAWNSSDNNCKEAAITISSSTITSIGDACELTLGGSSGHWTFFDGTYYIYAAGTATTKSNYMRGKTVKDDACEWTITIDQGETSVVSVTNDKTPHMQYNSGNSLFSCYNTASQSPVTLFRKPGVAFIDPIASCGEEYTITIDKNNGSAACSSCGAKVTENATTLSNLVAPTWAGHQVDYYMVAPADNSTKIAEANGTLAKSVTVSTTPWTDSDGKWVKGGDATIYAKWKYAEYAIAYYDQGGGAFSGVHGTDYPTTHTYNTATTLVNPTKNGFTFGGWYTSSDCSTGLVTSLGATAYTSGPINLYAKWTGKTYTVTWVVNGNTIATQNNVTYGTTYEDLSSTPANPADNALADCGSDKFVGWVTAKYTAEGGTKVLQYDPYAVTDATVINDDHHTFYAMFAKESGTAFTLDGTAGSTQDVKISCIIGGTSYYATGTANSSGYSGTTDAASANTYTFTKVSDGIYTIKKGTKYVIQKTAGKTALDESNTSFNWEISTPGSNGTWRVKCKTNDEARAIIGYKNTNSEDFGDFKAYATSNTTGGNASMYFDLELGTSNLTNYRTGCCEETIKLTVNDATSGTGGTVAMKWNNVSKSSGDDVSTCSQGTLVVEVTANPTYTLTAIAIAGTNKTITIVPSDLTTGLPSTSKMTYTVTVPSLATGTLTITPTFTRTYSVTYDLNGGETSGSTDVANYQSGATVTLVTPDPTKTGYNFSGWTVTKAGGGNVTVSAGQFTMPADNVTVTAGWTAKTLSSISVSPTTAEVYVGQYVQIPVTYDPADILTKGYTLVSSPGYCVTTGSTNTTLKITGGRGGVTITETKVETVSIKADADDTKRASVTVTVKPLPVDKFVDLIHGETFADQAASIVDNNLTTAYSAPGHADVPVPVSGNTCEKEHLHLVGWIESEWANAHLTATMLEIIDAEDAEHNPLFFAVYAPMNASGKTYYAVWGKEVTP